MTIQSFLFLATAAFAGGASNTCCYPQQNNNGPQNLRRDSLSILAIDSFTNSNSTTEQCLKTINSKSELVSDCPSAESSASNSHLYIIAPFSTSAPNKLTIKSFSDGKCNILDLIALP